MKTRLTASLPLLVLVVALAPSPREADGARTPAQAVAWAKSMVGSAEYPYLCLRFAYDAYQTSHRGWGNAKHAGDALMSSTGADPPFGALVFYDWWGTLDGTYTNWGHVAVCVGEGRVVSALGDQGVKETPIGMGTSMPYKGWGFFRDVALGAGASPNDFFPAGFYQSDKPVNCVAVSQDGSYIVVGASDGVHLLNREGDLIWKYQSEGTWTDYPIIDVSMTADASEIAAAGSLGYFWGGKVYFFSNLEKEPDTITLNNGVSSVAYSPEGDYFGITYTDGLGWNDVVALWGNKEGKWLWYKNFGGDASTDVVLCRNGDYVAVGGAPTPWTWPAGGLRLYNKPASVLWEYPINTTFGDKYSMAISSDGQYIAAGSRYDNFLYLSDCQYQFLWKYDIGQCRGVSISSDGYYIVAASLNRVHLFDRLKNLLWHSEFKEIQDIEISGDGNTIVVAKSDNEVRILTRGAPRPPPLQFHGVIVGMGKEGERSRGDKDASAIYNALLDDPNVKGENLWLLINPKGRNDVFFILEKVLKKLNPGDQLLFYYSGHGGYFGVDRNAEPAVQFCKLAQWKTGDESNTGEEFIVGDTALDDITDDRLSAWLSSDPKMAGVRKIVILDTCFAGGFWGREGNEGDEGDLDKIQDVGLLASCSERCLSFSNPITGRGFFSRALEQALKQFRGSFLSFTELRDAVSKFYTVEQQGNLGVIKGNDDGAVEIDNLKLDTAFSADFDPRASIVPHTLRVTKLFICEGQRLCVTWKSRPNDIYVVWMTLDLASNKWVDEDTIASQGAETSWTTAISNGGMRFYRIEMK